MKKFDMTLNSNEIEIIDMALRHYVNDEPSDAFSAAMAEIHNQFARLVDDDPIPVIVSTDEQADILETMRRT